ncbi:hypothetical protein PIB30_078196 [Stylosanthes scabra]|uniref:Uncharacterized protein n=1 Tax=Stylosanthes scabra TaxID=79078 RepID=A0ABU6URK0_9FABA|nr:hypothetical protein [Stylosanthes scabra]
MLTQRSRGEDDGAGGVGCRRHRREERQAETERESPKEERQSHGRMQRGGGKDLHRHIVAELHRHRRHHHLRHPVAVIVLRRGETKLEEREDVAGSPLEQGGSHHCPPLASPFTDVAVAQPETSRLGFFLLNEEFLLQVLMRSSRTRIFFFFTQS